MCARTCTASWASSQQWSNNESSSWKRSKQLRPLYLFTLRRGTLQVEHSQVAFLPCWLCFWKPSEWSRRQHQTQLVCFRAEHGTRAILWLHLFTTSFGLEKKAFRLLLAITSFMLASSFAILSSSSSLLLASLFNDEATSTARSFARRWQNRRNEHWQAQILYKSLNDPQTINQRQKYQLQSVQQRIHILPVATR